jgi:hypothetical protein
MTTVILLLFTIALFIKLTRLFGPKEMNRIRNLTSDRRQIELIKIQSKMTDAQVNHTFHFLLFLCTLSIWLTPWLLISFYYRLKRNRLNKLMEAI